jgi:thiol-disulfide isomerase/thioredoxin
MPVIEDNKIKSIFDGSLKKSLSYSEYREMVSDLVENESTTGAELTEAMVNYTLLNDRRMRRWDKTIKVSEEVISKVKNRRKKVTWLVLTESWCGDAAHVMPVMNKIAELNDNIDLKVVLRDENEELMNEFLTNGGKSIPKLIAIDHETGDVINTYGPRPSMATDLVNEYKAKHGVLSPEFKEDLQRWYNKDKGQTAIQDLLELLDK